MVCLVGFYFFICFVFVLAISVTTPSTIVAMAHIGKEVKMPKTLCPSPWKNVLLSNFSM